MSKTRYTWLALILGIPAMLVALTVIATNIGSKATREMRQDLNIEETKILTIDHGKRLRVIEDCIKEQRPVWRAVARKLHVEVELDSLPASDTTGS